MLNQDSLAQLKGLKTQMEAEKERAEAVVKGTQARYGFAVLDDGREVFIPPDEMLKVFPEDRVQVCIRPTKDNKTIADIEKLIDCPLGDFTGRCVRKGKALFVEPDLPQLRRWLFIPPHARNGVKDGDYVRAAVLRHPIRDGKPQAKILSVIGDETTPGIENLYSMAKYHLSAEWATASRKELEQLLQDCRPLEQEHRRDLTDLEFISIDAAKTQDIDDALYAQISDEGWTLFVAIADPTSYIPMDSSLYRDVAARGTSVYFHGDVLPMLPEELSQETCALSEGADRPALVCKIAINDSGQVGEYEFIEATIRSRAKLSYYAVDKYLTGQNQELMMHASPLEALYQVYRALRGHREEHHLVMEDRQEYRWIMGDDKQIDHIEPFEKLLSQKLVEECMIAANRCAARHLAESSASGPFITHPGFRSDRQKEAQKFLEMHAADVAAADLSTVDGYRKVIRELSRPEHELPLRTMVNRLLTRAEISAQPAPHMGMALEYYTNCTSPLRKYLDFLVHLQIKASLHEQPAKLVDTALLENLAGRISTARSATLEAERWLAGKHLARVVERQPEKTFKATVVHVNSSGFNVRLTDNGLDGFVDLRKDPEKFSYDKWTASLTSTTRRFQLEQEVEVLFTGVDRENQHQASFELVAGCGLKPPREDKKAEE
ncbi:VacB/RNase II family 3'-5' exoribonuclease [Pseudohalioglobus sediminis]|uniref:exoribonuclease II n=1 Tax=Pseudohalioglobus sediminis TaxID=2606449 RepID=A0A5B0WPJ2_9GAMM|nr:VacB/RNase II family 3'-5' exoribonuclease [Pseudohalioglobus sediminis]KAA1188980.1 VacB/RNase II family 3'-5' exoribonuclease [Pseudohalioglobus sediminis]